MEGLLEDVRVDATPEVIVRGDATRPLADLITAHSRATDLTLLGMQRPERDAADAYADLLHDMVEGIGTVLLIHNARSRVDLLHFE